MSTDDRAPLGTESQSVAHVTLEKKQPASEKAAQRRRQTNALASFQASLQATGKVLLDRGSVTITEGLEAAAAAAAAAVPGEPSKTAKDQKTGRTISAPDIIGTTRRGPRAATSTSLAPPITPKKAHWKLVALRRNNTPRGGSPNADPVHLLVFSKVPGRKKAVVFWVEKETSASLNLATLGKMVQKHPMGIFQPPNMIPRTYNLRSSLVNSYQNETSSIIRGGFTLSKEIADGEFDDTKEQHEKLLSVLNRFSQSRRRRDKDFSLQDFDPLYMVELIEDLKEVELLHEKDYIAMADYRATVTKELERSRKSSL
ncbi:hypothetical protein B0H63DRAFT_482048 [Podospora didyma]|uniref:Uncharacterized protein n=1 Tax=Podospora didyma TaxID=330526 RepID=A0AAE0N9F9_9PEZI|nr:hypothetical protein B0H63DRAFT_482048 [Podospora didyma]